MHTEHNAAIHFLWGNIRIASVGSVTTGVVWILGASGLIGSSVARAVLNQATHDLFVPNLEIVWPNPTWKPLIQEFKYRVGRNPWNVIWAAGTMRALDNTDVGARECLNFEAFCTDLRQIVDLDNGTLMFLSSAGGIYGGSRDVPFRVETPVAPANAYGWSKLCQENKVSELREAGLRVQIVRPTNVYGVPTPGRVHRGIVGRLLEAAMSGTAVDIYSPLNSRRDYMYADDLADVLVDLISGRASDQGTDVYLLGSGTAYSLRGVIDTVQEVTLKRIKLIQKPVDLSQPHDILVHSNHPGRWRSLKDGIKAVAEGLAKQ